MVRAELIYDDPEAALAWLETAFGFETRMVVRDPNGRIAFSETGFGDHTVAVLRAALEGTASPSAVGGYNTQVIQFRISSNVDHHFARARAAGARILAEPQVHFFGDRTYIARDLEGHIWTFAERIKDADGPPPPGWTVEFPHLERVNGAKSG